MIRLWNKWVRLFARTERGETLAVFRIACGLCVVGYLGTVIANDLVGILWYGPQDGGNGAGPGATWLMRALGGPTVTTVWAVVLLTLLAGICTTVGLGGRLAPLVAGQGLMALIWSNAEASGAYDSLLLNLLWILVLSRSTATWSLDSRIRSGSWAGDAEVPTWPRYLVIFQMVVVYFSSGIQKLSMHWTPWGGFSALYYILQQPDWQRFDMTWLAYVYPLTQVGTALVWFWELSSPLLLLALYFQATRARRGRLRRWFNHFDLRVPFLCVGVTMHLLTWYLMDLGPFSYVSLAMFPCLLRPAGIRGFVARCEDRFASPARRAPAS